VAGPATGSSTCWGYLLELLGLFVLIASLDFVVDRDLSLLALYLIPTLYSQWDDITLVIMKVKPASSPAR
jgi:hypothetical protein